MYRKGVGKPFWFKVSRSILPFVCFRCRMAIMRAAANEILGAASVRHSWGTVCAVLESLTAAHAVHLELVPHGMFLKAHYKKEHKDKCARDGSVPPCSSACLSMGSFGYIFKWCFSGMYLAFIDVEHALCELY